MAQVLIIVADWSLGRYIYCFVMRPRAVVASDFFARSADVPDLEADQATDVFMEPTDPATDALMAPEVTVRRSSLAEQSMLKLPTATKSCPAKPPWELTPAPTATKNCPANPPGELAPAPSAQRARRYVPTLKSLADVQTEAEAARASSSSLMDDQLPISTRSFRMPPTTKIVDDSDPPAAHSGADAADANDADDAPLMLCDWCFVAYSSQFPSNDILT